MKLASKAGRVLMAAIGLAFSAAALSAQTAEAQAPASPLPAPVARPLSLEEAVAAGLASDPGIRSGSYDLVSSRAKAMDALFRMIPSLALSGGYTQLSPEPELSFSDLPKRDLIALAPYSSTLSALAPVFNDLLPSITSSKDVRIDLQYPIFAGFRVKEAAAIAKAGALGKEAGLELTKRALVFDITKAYWETSRASGNVDSLSKSLDMENVVMGETQSLADQGMATSGDLLDEQARHDQAALSLDEARAGLAMATLVLASMTGYESAAKDPGEIDFDLVTKPGAAPFADPGSDVGTLIESALAARPETKLASATLSVYSHAKAASSADLMPTLLVTGSLAYSDPDPRMFPPADVFNLNWSAGLRLRYDVGGIPGAIARGQAAEADLQKARADIDKARNGIAMDVRRCVLTVNRTRNSLELTKGMVNQAEENLHVTQAKYDNGVAKRSDLLKAQIALLRAQFSVTSRTIDVEIAEADLQRALASRPMP